MLLKVEPAGMEDASDGGEKRLLLRFSVSDTGIGIPQEKIESVFERFSQVDASTTRKFGGTGLGLAISRKLVKMMGGSLQVESREGEGSVFFFTLPLTPDPAAKTKTAEPAAARLRGMRVLVVDDNDTNRLILRQLLSGWQMHVTDVASGREALAEMQRARGDSRSFDLVLVDGQMPEMDGFALARRIRNTPDLAATTLMMLTSDDRIGDARRARSLSIGGYLVKPIKKSELEAALQTVLARSASPEAGRVREAAADTQEIVSRKILLVDDSVDNRLLARTFLQKAGHRVVEAENGREAVDKFQESAYDLVLMDVQMPEMDGYTAAGAIRQWEQQTGAARTPIIALTAHAFQEDESKSLASGCDAHMSKPIQKTKLLETVAALVLTSDTETQ